MLDQLDPLFCLDARDRLHPVEIDCPQPASDPLIAQFFQGWDVQSFSGVVPDVLLLVLRQQEQRPKERPTDFGFVFALVVLFASRC